MLEAPAAAVSGSGSLDLVLADEAATVALAVSLAAVLKPGDMVALSGDLGSGKTTFARALIRHLAGDATLEVPSPTFTLLQVYDLVEGPVVHADLYRVQAAEELVEMGFDDLARDTVVLVEWPDRAAGLLRADRIEVEFELDPEGASGRRRARITAQGEMAGRTARMTAIDHFIAEAGFAEAKRVRVKGDASTRAYERLETPDRRVVLMNAPRRPDGPPVRNGLPY